MCASLVIVVSFSGALRSQQPSVATPHDTTSRAALVVAGGVSLGSYYAGATWAFIYALRDHEALARAREGYAPLASFPAPAPYRLDVLTGASAGNINALLAGLEYCASEWSRDPDATLLSQFWIGTGWSELVNEPVREQELAVLTRASAEPVWRSIDSTMRSPRRNADCDLLLGITTTKLTPRLVHVGPAIDVPIQRFAGVFRLVADAAGLAFAEPRASDLASQELSDIVVLDPATDARRVPLRLDNRVRDYALSLEGVRQIVEASGSFPLAFAPRRIAYRTLDTLRRSGQGPGPAIPCLTSNGACTPPDTSLFVDGGLFDNRPLGLALGLAHSLDGARPPRRLLYFVDEDARRLERPESTGVIARREPRAGVAAAIRVFYEAVNTSYNTELREFVRHIEREPGSRVSLGVNTRHPRLMAEHFAHFGAFLARSFREHDFYAGVYDGLRSAFRALYCGTPADPACEEAWVRLVLEKELVALRPAGRAAVDRFLYHETGGAAPALPEGAGFQARALVALADANVDARRPGERCVARASFIDSPLCTERFLTVVEAWEDSLETIGGWKREFCDGAGRERYGDDCRVVQDPQAVYHGVILETLARARQAELVLKRQEGSAWSGVVGIPLFYQRAYNESFRSCFQPHNLPCVDVNPSSSDVMGGWWYSWGSRLLPIAGAMRRDGQAHWLEWRPTAYLARVSSWSISASAPLELMRADQSTFGAYGASITVMPPVALLSSVSVSEIWSRGRPTTDLTISLVSGTVRLGLRGNESASLGEFASLHNLTFGIGDANGLGARLLGWIASVALRR